MVFVNGVDLDIEQNCLAIAITRSDLGSHIGIVFHSKSEGLKLLHLRFHKLATVDDFPHSRECWIARPIKLPPAAAKQLVAYIRSVATYLPNLNSISYGINCQSGVGSFNAQGEYSPPVGSDGLTCATFVVEVLRGASIVVLDVATWEPNEQNKIWGEQVCALLEKHKDSFNITDDHISTVRNNNIGLRIRPEEVAFSVCKPTKEWPTVYEVAFKESVSVLHCLNSICPI